MHSHIIESDGVREAAEINRMLSDPTRLRILKLLFQNPDGMCVYEIATEVRSSSSATSHQLAKLEAHTIVVCYREGQKMCYEIADTELAKKIKSVLQLFSII